MSIPEMRSFQFGNEAVNLFRGDVDLPLTLFSLPSRNGLDVSIGLLYTSNVHTQVENWNVETPTSIMGLGWQLPRERIEIDPRGSASLIDNIYYYVANENRVPLLASTLEWQLFTIGIEYIAYFDKGEIPQSLQEKFAQNALLLSTASTVEKNANGLSWQIFDPIYERIFTVYQDNDQLKIIDGGKQYELQNYQFWKISYYPHYEKWFFINENGMRFIYGGKVQEQDGLKKAQGNSIEWGVQWENWIGSSTLEEAQSQYPLSWNLSEASSLWGDRVYYIYESIEQRVGEQGLTYTKSCYLSSIIDVFKKEIVFSYQDKVFDNSTPDGPREYADPHKPIPDNNPNAYQDRYETRFLDKIYIKNARGEILQYFQFFYAIFNASSVVNGNPLYGDTVKRYLTGIQQFTATGDPLPGLAFDYYTNSDDTHPGALKTVTSPTGGTTTYLYEKVSLPLANRSIEIQRPIDKPIDTWTPKIWFGPDYAVVAWYNTDSHILRVSTYTWLGMWYEWQEGKIDVTIKLDIETLNVIANNDFFSLSYQETDQDIMGLYLIHKQINALGKWNSSQLYRFATARAQLAVGNKFILILDPDQYQLYRYTWQWQTRTWQEETLPLQNFTPLPQTQCRYYLTAGNNLFLILAYDIVNEDKTNTLHLTYLDDQDQWLTTDPLSVNDIYISSAKEQGNFYWSLGTSFAVGTYITQNSAYSLQYDVQIFGWDKNYYLYSSYKKEDLQIDKPIQFVPAVINNSLVGSGPYLFRYNGQAWQFKDMKLTVPANLKNVFWFAYGEDFALVTENAVGQIISLFSAYNPNQDSSEWKTNVVELVNEASPPFRQTRYFPTASGSIFTLDKAIYARGLAASWEKGLSQPIYSLPESELVDTTTFVNGAPGFLTYLEYEENNPAKETHVLTMKNGQVRSALTTPNQLFQIYNDQGYNKPYLNGKYPAGPYSFYTFPIANTLDDTPYITLHRYLTDEIAGQIDDYRIQAISTYDGFETRYTCYHYDDQTAIPDPSGSVIKYYNVRVYPGCPSPEEAQDGYLETIYINGLPADISGINHSLLSEYNNSQDNYSILDGFLDVKNTYDNQGLLIATEKNDWFVKTDISDFIDKQAFPIQGYYTLLKQVTSSIEGITTTAQTEYDFASGQIIQRQTTNYNAQGQLETWIEATSYAYQAYPALQHLNILPVVIQSKTQVQGANNAITKLYVTRLKPWLGKTAPDTNFPLAIYAIYDNFQWQGGEENPQFTAWDTEDMPSSDWKGSSTIIVRATNGLVLETKDVLGRYASTLYDSRYQYPVASFTNARLSLDQADYLGFEDYEAGDNWTIGSKSSSWRTYVTTKTSNTGQCALQLSASTTGTNSLQRIFKPSSDKSYLLTSWYKTSENFLANETAYWRITILDQGQEVSRSTYPFIATHDEWTYINYVINLEDYQESEAIEIIIDASNNTSADVYIDNVRCSPFLSSFSANVYHTRYDLQLASIGPNQQIQRSIYNHLWQTAIDIGPDENINKFGFQYYSRQDNVSFNAAQPNAAMHVTGMEKGFYSNFQRDGGYQKHWSTADPDTWAVEQGQLHYQGGPESTIALKTPDFTERYAAYISVEPQESITQPLGINIGQTAKLQWNPLQKTWSLDLLNDSQQYIFNTDQTEVAKEWVVYCYDHILLFFADGKQIFAHIAQQPISGNLQLFTANKIAFYNMTFCSQPQLVVTYSDGWEKGRQSQMLSEAASVVNEIVYDHMGRAVIQTKAAHLNPTDEIPLLSFRPNFVTSIDWQSGLMQGEISTYYSATGGGFSDDEGYPYTRTLYEQSPLARPIESGLAGKDFAIINPYTTDPSSRKTSKVRYATNKSTDPINWLPENQYFVTTTIDADGNTSFSLSDQNNNVVGTGTLVDKENHRYTITTYQSAYTNIGKTVTGFLPNYYYPPQKAVKEQWQTTTHYNMLDQAITSDAPNVGIVETIYDWEGKVRFSQDAKGRAENYYLYLKYDILGRIIEDGRIENKWNTSQLQYYANSDPSWPLNIATWGKRMVYNGAGTNPNTLLRLSSVEVRDNTTTDQLATVEHFAYDIQGNITQHKLDVVAENRSYTTDYTYNNQNKVVSISYPEVIGQERIEIYYFYNEGGLIQSVGCSKEQPEYYASYRYNTDGSLCKESFNQVKNLERSYQYISPGWLQSIADPYYQQNMYYTQDTQGRPGYFTGLVVEETFNFQGDFPLPLTKSYAYHYEYDHLNQLVIAKNKQGDTINPQWSIGLDGEPTRYDDNGNILQIKQGENIQQYEYILGTDKVKNTKATASDDYIYDQNGHIISAKTKSINAITYNKTTQFTDSIKTDKITLNFIYDSNNRRIAKKSLDSTKFYNYGLSSHPLTEITQANDTSESITHYIHGANGLLGFKKDHNFYSILQDRVGSSRVLLSNATILSGYTYLPFGDFMDNPQLLAALSYYYTGQELDQEIDLYNYKARFYDPALGRFYSPDAAGQFASPYLYGANNPIMFIDPSGNIALGALIGIIGGGLAAIVGGIAITIASFGTLTAAGIALSLGGATAIGAGLASVSYSAFNTNNWSAKGWAISTAVGAVTGLVSAGIGVGIGAGINVTAQTMATVGRQAVVRIGLSIIAGGAEGTATNVATTAISNAALGTNQKLADAAWQGALIGALTGGVGGIMGVKSAARKAHANSRFGFANGSKAQIDGMHYDPSSSREGLTGLLNITNNEFSLGSFVTGAHGPAHIEMAVANYRVAGNARNLNHVGIFTPDPLEYPDLRGFSIRKRADDITIELGFGSTSLNADRYVPTHSRFLGQDHAYSLLLATRYQLGIKPNIDGQMAGNQWGGAAAGAFAQFLRSPFS